MAKIYETYSMCDIGEHGPATASGSFSLDGRDYVIDLCEHHKIALGAALGKFLDHARRTGRTFAGKKSRTTADRRRSLAVRAWALAQGMDVADQGALPAKVLAAYKASH